MVHSTTPGAPTTAFTKVELKLTADQQIEYVMANVQGLSREQTEFLLKAVHKRDGSVVFGGSRVRGAARVDPEGKVISDLDVGFEGLTRGQINGIMNDFNKKFGGSTKTKIIEHNWIYPGSTPRGIPEIVSPEEFFLRSGARADGPKSGQPFGPSGYIKVKPDGGVEAGRL
jgi:hypothetical protein